MSDEHEMPMMDTSVVLTDMIRMADGFAEAAFREKGAVRATYIAFTEDEVMVVPAPPVNDKNLALLMVRVLFAEKGVRAYVYFDEAWVVMSPEDRGRSLKESVDDFSRQHPDGLEHAPGRMEVVHMWAENATGKMQAQRLITRDPNALGPLEINVINANESMGRMTDLLPRPPASTLN